MKKFFTSCLMIAFGVMTSFAQGSVDETLQFVDKQGNVVPNGSVLKLTELEGDDFMKMIKAGLDVKNTSSQSVDVFVKVNVTQQDHGDLQVCFPKNCMMFHLGEDKTTTGTMAGNEQKDLQTEWVPGLDDTGENPMYGKCVAELQLVRVTVDEDGQNIEHLGSKVILDFEYSNTSGIDNLSESDKVSEVVRYNANGQIVSSPVKGLNIVKMSNGKTVKTVER